MEHHGGIQNICCYAKHTSPTVWTFTFLGMQRNVHDVLGCFQLANLDFHILQASSHRVSQLTMALSNTLFLSLIVKYIDQCGGGVQLIVGPPPPQFKMQNQLCWSGKMHIITKPFNWPRLLYCFCWLDQCTSWTLPWNLIRSFWTVYAKLPHCFSLFCLPFGSLSKHYNCCKMFTLSLNQSQVSFKINMTKLSGSSWTGFFFFFLMFKKKSVCECCSWKLFTNNVHGHCSCIKNQL